MADVIEEILSWPLDAAVVDDFNYFVYDSLEIQSPVYIKGDNLIDGDDPSNDGGSWSGVNSETEDVLGQVYIDFAGYIQVSFTANKFMDLYGIDFSVANFFTGSLLVDNFYAKYFINNDFAHSTIIYDYPEGNITAYNPGFPGIFDYMFEMPIKLKIGDIFYVRFYPYKFDPFFSAFVLMKNSIFINGVIRDVSTVSSLLTLNFNKDCTNSNNLTWT